METIKIKNEIAEYDVSCLVFGTTYLGNYDDKEKAFSHLQEYYNLGGRCIDTARVYSNLAPEDIYPSENVIGEWLSKTGLRNEIVISTKGGHPPYGDMLKSRLSFDEISYDLEQSLKALKTEFIDIYWLHRDDESIEVSEIINSLNKLINTGKIKVIGASNWSVNRIEQANAYAEANGLIGFSASQIQWSLAKTSPSKLNDETLVCMNEHEYAFYEKSKIPVMVYNAQAKGLFSKLAKVDGDITKLPQKVVDRFLSGEYHDQNLKIFDKILILANKYNVAPTMISLSYITSNMISATAIIGCSNLEQIQDSMKSQDFKLTKEDIEFLNKN